MTFDDLRETIVSGRDDGRISPGPAQSLLATVDTAAEACADGGLDTADQGLEDLDTEWQALHDKHIGGELRTRLRELTPATRVAVQEQT